MERSLQDRRQSGRVSTEQKAARRTIIKQMTTWKGFHRTKGLLQNIRPIGTPTGQRVT